MQHENNDQLAGAVYDLRMAHKALAGAERAWTMCKDAHHYVRLMEARRQKKAALRRVDKAARP